jgi:hypothetical protein
MSAVRSAAGTTRLHFEGNLDELAADLLATAAQGGARSDVSQWMTRPGILRRIASRLSVSIPADADRILAVGPGAVVLGSAVSLATGLPFSALGDRGPVFGSLHDDERVAVVSADEEALSVIDQLAARRVVPASIHVVMARRSILDSRPAVPTFHLFLVDAAGGISVEEGPTHD